MANLEENILYIKCTNSFSHHLDFTTIATLEKINKKAKSVDVILCTKYRLYIRWGYTDYFMFL